MSWSSSEPVVDLVVRVAPDDQAQIEAETVAKTAHVSADLDAIKAYARRLEEFSRPCRIRSARWSGW